MFFILLIIASLLALIYYFSFKPYKYWIKKGICQANPKPPFGDVWKAAIQMEDFIELTGRFYNAASGKRYFGLYQMFKPILLVRDIDLIKQITVKDFDHFLDHDEVLPEGIDPLWSKNMFALKGENWRNMRVTLSPSFTSSKMKQMFIFMSECSENFTNHFLNKKDPVISVVFKDIFTRYTNDVIASTAFGIKCDSLENPENEFYLMGKELSQFGFLKNLSIIIASVMPSISKIIDCRLFSEKVSTFFTETIKDAIKLRETGKVVRPDMIQLLIESRKNGSREEDDDSGIDTGFATSTNIDVSLNKKGKQLEITDDDIAAQALVFFFAGFETTSSLMSLIGYELGVNQDIQRKLQAEIDKTLSDCNGKLTYETLVRMKYLDMVVSETLRKWPPTIATDRRVTKPYTINPVTPDEKPIHLDVGDNIWIPTYSIHRDPKYYANPDQFDPERFSDENKTNINQYTFLTFGIGPRNCIGSRFALLEIKALYFHLLSKFDIVPVEKTKIPFEIDKSSFTITSKDGFRFGLKRRDNNVNN